MDKEGWKGRKGEGVVRRDGESGEGYAGVGRKTYGEDK